jgi:hypothetical protein
VSVTTVRTGGAIYGDHGARQAGVYGGTGPNSGADAFVIENNTSAGISILTPNTSTGVIYFGDPDNNVSGRINYAHGTDTMSFYTAGALTASLDSAGVFACVGGFSGNGTSITGINAANISAGILPAARVTSVSASATINGETIGYQNIPTLVDTNTATASAVGKVYLNTGNIAFNNAVFSAGDVVCVYNNSAAAITLTQGASTTMRLAGTTVTGSRTLAPRGWATVFWIASNQSLVSGAGVS